MKTSSSIKIIITLWLTSSVLYGAYLYNEKMAYCLANWLPTGLNIVQASNLCFNSFLHTYSTFFIPITILTFVLYKLWSKNNNYESKK